MTEQTLKDTAIAYVPVKTLNITDLDRVDLSFPTFEREGKKTVKVDGKDVEETWKYRVMNVNGIDYKVPNPVMEQIQTICELRPDTNFVKVTSTGSGVSTRYTTKRIE